jgi:hypothetical protein
MQPIRVKNVEQYGSVLVDDYTDFLSCSNETHCLLVLLLQAICRLMNGRSSDRLVAPRGLLIERRHKITHHYHQLLIGFLR